MKKHDEDTIDHIVKKIAHGLEDYEQISKVKMVNGREIWNKLTLSHGLPGICMLFGKLMDCDKAESTHWETMGRQYMGYIVDEINHNGMADMSLYSGLSGVGLAAACLSKDFVDYTKLSSVINQNLSAWIQNNAKVVSFHQGTHAMVYDVIAGMTGILSYLGLFAGDNICREGLECGLDMLIAMAGDISIQGITVPGWYIPSQNQFTQMESDYFPNGNFNTGVAHGIAGPLILLSQMMMDGVNRPGQMEAIKKITDFLMKYRLTDSGRTIWNGQIDFDRIKEGKPETEKVFHRDAWCYGAPGINYALICAGTVCRDRALVEFGIENLRLSVANIEGIHSPTICHGYAGIYQILDAVEQLLQATCFEPEKEQIKNQILNYYDESAPYGFRDYEPDGERKQIQAADVSGFLCGATGVALGLYSVEHPQNNIWRKALLLV